MKMKLNRLHHSSKYEFARYNYLSFFADYTLNKKLRNMKLNSLTETKGVFIKI